jgi:hypothetical protein
MATAFWIRSFRLYLAAEGKVATTVRTYTEAVHGWMPSLPPARSQPPALRRARTRLIPELTGCHRDLPDPAP